MFRKKDKNQGIPDGVVGNNLKNARLTKSAKRLQPPSASVSVNRWKPKRNAIKSSKAPSVSSR